MSRPLNYKIKTLEKMFDRKFATIAVYLTRPEFKHIKIVRNKSGKFFSNVTWEDIKALRSLFESRRCNKY